MANKRGSGSYDYIEAQDRWRWRGYYIDPVTGKRKIKSIYSKSKKDLREKVEEWLLQSESGRIEVDMTLAKWVDIWLGTVIGDTVKLRTKEIYTHILLNHVVPRFGTIKLSRLSAQSYQEFLNEQAKQYSPNTVATIRRYTIMCLDCAVRYG